MGSASHHIGNAELVCYMAQMTNKAYVSVSVYTVQIEPAYNLNETLPSGS